jgi:glycyl-tRNA synthetase beta chain
MADFLLEIGTEEIPARMIDGAREELAKRVGDVLKRERLSEAPEVEAYSTPRRLTVVVPRILSSQPDVSEQLTGPSLKVAYKDGQPTPAADAFAKKAGIAVEKLQKTTTAKGEYLVATVLKKGRPASEILAEALPKEIAGIYWAKNMYWRGKSAERFVRPVRWMVSLLDDEVVPVEFAGIRAGNISEGHRILSSGPLEIGNPSEYADKLSQGAVVPSSAAREERIRKALDHAARTIPGARWRDDNPLLETVVNLTEFPSVILGSFDAEFLSLPDEVLVTVMRDHQKYFALEDPSGRLLPHFLAVLNTDGDPDGLIRHGNERVLRARFNDARFFWQTDQKVSLRDRVPMLRAVTFQKDLGSYYDKTRRVQKLASLLSETLRSAGTNLRPGVVHKAALLAKTDLTTELVKEFTELQGIVGGLYARVQELDPSLPKATAEAIADTIYDQYKPESMEDDVPRSVEGAVLAVADKADSIAGMFALGLIPSGSKDPFALRRAANGIVKIIAEHKLPVSIEKLFEDVRAEYAGSNAEKVFRFKEPVAVSFLENPEGFSKVFRVAIADFMRERVAFYLRDVLGFSYDTVNAVLATPTGSDDVVDAIARARAVTDIRETDQFKRIAVAFKRMKNIVKRAQQLKLGVAEQLDRSLFTETEERLFSAMEPAGQRFEAARAQRNYPDALAQLSQLGPYIDKFFDDVMILAEDKRLQQNRLKFINRLGRDFAGIADFSEIVTEAK